MAKKEKEHRTNAVRIVAAKKIPYMLHTYEAPEGFLDGVSVAAQVGQDPDTVFKTLVLTGHSKQNYVCVIPVACRAGLEKSGKTFWREACRNAPCPRHYQGHRLCERGLFSGRYEEAIPNGNPSERGNLAGILRQRRQSGSADGAFAGRSCEAHRSGIYGFN